MSDPAEQPAAANPDPDAERRELVTRCFGILYGRPDGHAFTVQERAELLADLIEELRAEIPQDIDDLV